jgi:hypothetical protein
LFVPLAAVSDVDEGDVPVLRVKSGYSCIAVRDELRTECPASFDRQESP